MFIYSKLGRQGELSIVWRLWLEYIMASISKSYYYINGVSCVNRGFTVSSVEHWKITNDAGDAYYYSISCPFTKENNPNNRKERKIFCKTRKSCVTARGVPRVAYPVRGVCCSGEEGWGVPPVLVLAGERGIPLSWSWLGDGYPVLRSDWGSPSSPRPEPGQGVPLPLPGKDLGSETEVPPPHPPERTQDQRPGKSLGPDAIGYCPLLPCGLTHPLTP